MHKLSLKLNQSFYVAEFHWSLPQLTSVSLGCCSYLFQLPAVSPGTHYHPLLVATVDILDYTFSEDIALKGGVVRSVLFLSGCFVLFALFQDTQVFVIHSCIFFLHKRKRESHQLWIVLLKKENNNYESGKKRKQNLLLERKVHY